MNLKRLGVALTAILPVMALSGCSPAPYVVGLTLVNGQPAIYVPTCAGFQYRGIHISFSGDHGFGSWDIAMVDGPSASFIEIGTVPPGYKFVPESPQGDHNDEHPKVYRDATYQVSFYDVVPKGHDGASSWFTFTDAVENAFIYPPNNPTTKEQLDQFGNCSAGH